VTSIITERMTPAIDPNVRTVFVMECLFFLSGGEPEAG
jgi:hypothetical protein